MPVCYFNDMTVKSKQKMNVKKSDKEKAKDKDTLKTSKPNAQKEPIVDKEKSDALNLFVTIGKENNAFVGSWKGFTQIFKETIDSLTKYQDLVNQSKEEVEKRRSELLEKLKYIIPTLKTKLGVDGSKNKLAYIIAVNLEGLQQSSISSIRRLLDRYEEKYGAIWPKALDNKAEEIEAAEGSQNHIDIVYQLFSKGKDELLTLVEQIAESIKNDKFDKLVINLNATKSKIKGFQLVVKGND